MPFPVVVPSSAVVFVGSGESQADVEVSVLPSVPGDVVVELDVSACVVDDAEAVDVASSVTDVAVLSLLPSAPSSDEPESPVQATPIDKATHEHDAIARTRIPTTCGRTSDRPSISRA